ncbi:MAG: hypothetical protein CL910_11965 [Deltaproteobacteria bacterium]|nr:hypothetical protein [Deltaproteobacteria bacterium]
MQDRPTAAELLEAIGDLLEKAVLPGTRGPLRHPVRVAGNLCRILEREAELGSELEAREVEILRQLLGPATGDDVRSLTAELDRRLATEDDPEFQARAWRGLLEIVRGKLRIAKPGYDAYDFVAELPG